MRGRIGAKVGKRVGFGATKTRHTAHQRIDRLSDRIERFDPSAVGKRLTRRRGLVLIPALLDGPAFFVGGPSQIGFNP